MGSASGASGEGGSGAIGSMRVFIRPLAMLAIGLAAGVAMWLLLMADDGPRPWRGRRSDTSLAGPVDRLVAR